MITADTRPFERYHQILFWPLALTDSDFELEQYTKDVLSKDHNPWARLDPRNRGTTSSATAAYEEFVYFHPFTREFLYPSDPSKSFLCILGRKDIDGVKVEFYGDSFPEVRLTVNRIHLYIFRTQVAILAVEVSAEQVSRETVLRLEDEFRRIYTPYWDGCIPGHCPRTVQWFKGNEAVGECSDYELLGSMKGEVPPVSAHWKYLVQNLGSYKQIEDDRAAAMVFLIHPTPERLSGSDLARHCFYDGAGGPEAASYSPAFLATFERDYCYARFWDPDSNNWMKTLHMCCGYGFTTITTPGGAFLLEHFRHHYFQLGLLVHFHRSTLLQFSSLFTSVMPTDETGEQPYRRLLEVRRQFARFVSTSWFHEVTNQEQGRELFDLWSRHLRTEELMENILSEASAVDAVFRAYEQDKRDSEILDLTKSQRELAVQQTTLATSQTILAKRVEVLTILLYAAAAATLVVAFLDSEAIRELIKHGPLDAKWTWFWALSLVDGVWLGLGAIWLYGRLLERVAVKKTEERAGHEKLLRWALLGAALLTAAVTCWLLLVR